MEKIVKTSNVQKKIYEISLQVRCVLIRIISLIALANIGLMYDFYIEVYYVNVYLPLCKYFNEQR